MTVSLTATSAPPPSAKGLQSKGHGSAPRPGQRMPEVPEPNGDQTARDRSRTKTITLATAILRSRLAQDLLFFFVFSCEKPSLCNVCVDDSEALTLDRRWPSAELSAAKPLSSALLNSQHIDLGIWGFTESG